MIKSILSKIIQHLSNNRKHENTIVFFDTNCYRLISREHSSSLNGFISKMKKMEKKKCFTPFLNPLVASEMLTHLSDDIISIPYNECKYGLYTALIHIDKQKTRMLNSLDTELYKLFFNSVPINNKYKEDSLMAFILLLNEYNFSDEFIQSNITNFEQTKKYLQDVIDTWKNSTINYFIKKHDTLYSGDWQVFVSDKQKRNLLLNKIREAKETCEIFKQFALGVCGYVENNFGKIPIINYEISLVNYFNSRCDFDFRL